MRTLSGIQPTGNLHLGNYLGAIRNWVRMQDDMPGEKLYFLADLHAITVHNDPAELTANTREMAAALMAAGIDPDKAILFNQARVPAHAELAWLLFCTARIGWLNRMTQFKEKSGKNREGASVGLYAYPVLQAADVLLYQTTHVPVGDDQKQHLELARDIATKFNLDTGTETFTLPEPTIPPTAARIMSLRDGTAKMSKSDPSDASRINLIDDPDTIMAKIRKAKTDPEALPSEEKGLEGRPEAENLVGIYAGLSGATRAQVLSQFGCGQFSGFKGALVDLSVAKLAPIAAEMRRLLADPGHVDAILSDGADRADAIAAPIMRDVKDIVGFVRRR